MKKLSIYYPLFCILFKRGKNFRPQGGNGISQPRSSFNL
nr:MAG TPA: hypothetical protein [Caudoviricetes sp.]